MTTVTYTVDDGLASIDLDRPTASNALDCAMKELLLQALSAVRYDATIRAVALTASGKNFCVGQDLGEHVEALRADPGHAMDTVTQHYNPIMLALDAIEVPVVAGIGGACVGAGLGIALGADIRIAGQRAKFGTAFCGIGLASDSGLSATLATLIGRSRATGLFMLGDTIDADTALAWGLIHRVVPDPDVTSETTALARQLATGPTAAFKAVKQLITDNAGAALGDVLTREARAQALLGASTDHTTAVEAFLDKRRPAFVGQ
ncbi:enoyl-CoA hydratase-related protein [Mycobacterium sp.]|uniref:enoyl-CoA hydratase/isomerase family protein n=1 Tax=Mycobacterium sp. TaxID=1785 RepID=UPI00261EBDC3|nr:enoyl-CoA hydratase-related protein [Mycobacterium sp.]